MSGLQASLRHLTALASPSKQEATSPSADHRPVSAPLLAAEIGRAFFEGGLRSFLCFFGVVIERQRFEAERQDAPDIPVPAQNAFSAFGRLIVMVATPSHFP
ncbi:MAG TPA: hypothetical protein VHY35_16045 [Stellaceae bacterium]|nr:hypothetical protein [Stellaceae bacterium]